MIQTRGLGSRCSPSWAMLAGICIGIRSSHITNKLGWTTHGISAGSIQWVSHRSDAACHGNAWSCALMLSFVASSEGGWLVVAVQASLQQPCHPSPAPVDHLQRPPACSSPQTFCCPSSPVPCWPRPHLHYLLSSSSRTELGHWAAAERHHDLSLAITGALIY